MILKVLIVLPHFTDFVADEVVVVAFLSLFMFLQFFVASCVHFDGRVMSPGIPKTPSESPSHRCIFPFGGALYA